MVKKFKDENEFSDFIYSVLRQKCALNKQSFQISGNDPMAYYSNKRINYLLFDAIAPDGFEQIQGPVYFELKMKWNTGFLRRYASIDKRITIVIIVDDLVQNKVFSINKESSEYANIIIYDQTVIHEWIKEFPVDYNNAISLKNKRTASDIQPVNEYDFEKKSNNTISVLREIIDSNDNFALVLGAGVSIDLGAASWNDLLEKMKKDLSSIHAIYDADTVCERIGGTLLNTAQLCKELYKKEEDYYWKIHSSLYSIVRSSTKRYEVDSISLLIKKCQDGRNFRVLTYNYDDFLEKSLDEIGIKYNILFNQECMTNAKLSIYHAHGFFPQVNNKRELQKNYYDSIVLTESNYNDLYNHPYDWAIACQLSFFRENTCLFIGSSLSDPNIRRLLQITKSNRKNHFAIMVRGKTKEEDLSVLSNHFSKIGVEIIWVDNYANIVDTIEKLL